MALASWTGLYTPVVQSLMRQKRIKELLLLQVIAQHADPFGFAFPGPKTLLHLMRCSKATLERLLEFLEDHEYIKIYKTSNPRRMLARRSKNKKCDAGSGHTLSSM